MKTKETLKRFFLTGAVLYTIMSACILIISALNMGDSSAVSDTSAHYLNVSTHLFLLLFAYFASLGVCLAKSDIIPKSARIFIEAFGFIGGFFFFFVLPMKRGFSGSVMLTIGFAVAYVIIRTLICIILYDEKEGPKKAAEAAAKNASEKQMKAQNASAKSKKTQKKMKDEEYVSLFSDKSDK